MNRGGLPLAGSLAVKAREVQKEKPALRRQTPLETEPQAMAMPMSIVSRNSMSR